MAGLMKTARARTWLFLAGAVTFMAAMSIGVAVLVAGSVAGVSKADADTRALSGVDLLANIGTDIPNLEPAVTVGGLSSQVAGKLDRAVAIGQREGLLANLMVWNRVGRIVYSSADTSEGTRPPKEARLVTALAGRSVTQTHGHELDPTSGKTTGVLDAFEPLIDTQGHTYGAMEVSLPLKPIEAAARRDQDRILRVFIGGAIVVMVLLLPLAFRLARSQANEWIPHRRRTLRAVRRGLDNHEIELIYQPQVEPGSRRVEAVEALVRWRRNGQLVGPERFLAAVESSKLMGRLTDRVLDLALSQLAAWRNAGTVTRMSVNLSANDLGDTRLAERIAGKLEEHGVMGQSLTVEVTETALLDDTEQARRMLTLIDRMGIAIAVDDFGTGHASISRLHGLPVSEIKIDRSFVSNTQEHSRTYLSAMVVFGRSLGLRVVAEGVEDPETLALLTTLNCDLAQGYFISHPLEPAGMTHWLETADPAGTPSVMS